jgi:Na+/H+-dicarboxylate symporter
MNKGFWAHYGNMILLLTGILIGCLLGLIFREKILFLEPVGDIFLNLLFTVVVPLVFFAIASAIAHMEPSNQIKRLAWSTILVLTITVLISGMLTIVAIWIWPIHNSAMVGAGAVSLEHPSPGQAVTQLLTVSDFYSLFTRKSMLALIIFSVGVGLATLQAKEKGQAFRQFLDSGNEVIQRLLTLIMYLAPVGLGAYFACQMGKWGTEMLGTYGRAIAVLIGVSLVNYFVLFSIYALIAGGRRALKRYWVNIIIPSATALGTSSSIATIPANLDASRKMGIPSFINKLVIPLAGPLHKEASSITEVVKIYLMYSIFQQSLSGPWAVLMVLGVSLLVSIVEGGVPNGGYIGEVLTISVFGFPPSALPPMILVGTVTDPTSTLVNATGDPASAMLISRLTLGKDWMEEEACDP